ncbi:hypothetical protein SAMN04515668_1740 [Hymenobacter arizonensis]|uniref:Uncharacterized protein n=1 Tax=Hymenobacter arizonensis TaxID=1227077 RepID=A0A1I5XB01_HYMAR|nr:hypothetical protein SAMN04515668_1740 [Hymenobacter arizonensis]
MTKNDNAYASLMNVSSEKDKHCGGKTSDENYYG